MDKTTLGNRIKGYEISYENIIIPRIPIIIRCDGKNFSTFTKKFDKPFDEKFSNAMANTMFHTASKIDGCVFGYTQSDEITFVLRNDKTLETEPWFGNRIQKMCSVVSSMITATFAQEMGGWACFDARIFATPSLIEAGNAVIWRQNDCIKNSISTACYYEVGQKIGKGTARKKMFKLNQKQQQELLFQEVGINWAKYKSRFKNGIGCYRVPSDLMTRGYIWKLDEDLPRFSKDFDWLMGKFNAGYEAKK